MSAENTTIVLPVEIADSSDQINISGVEASESANPIDFAQNNPLDASLIVFGAVVVGLVLRNMVARPKH
jgi:hypothetical protein